MKKDIGNGFPTDTKSHPRILLAAVYGLAFVNKNHRNNTHLKLNQDKLLGNCCEIW